MQLSVTCPRCESKYQLAAEMRGKRMRCPNPICRAVFEVRDDNDPPKEAPPPGEMKLPETATQAPPSVETYLPEPAKHAPPVEMKLSEPAKQAPLTVETKPVEAKKP